MASEECIACAKKLTKPFVESRAPAFICDCGFPLDEDTCRKILGIEIEELDTAPPIPPPVVVSAENICPTCGVNYPPSQAAVWQKGTCYACGSDLSKIAGGPTLEDLHGQLLHGRVVAKIVGGDFDGSTIELFNNTKTDFGKKDIVTQLGEFDGVEKISRSHLKVVELGVGSSIVLIGLFFTGCCFAPIIAVYSLVKIFRKDGGGSDTKLEPASDPADEDATELQTKWIPGEKEDW